MTKYFTTDALPYTKRDLSKLGIDSKTKLLQPFPSNRLVCKLTVALRKQDDGTERNEVKNLEVIRVQEPPDDPFTPKDEQENGRVVQEGDEADDTDFPYGANADGGPKS
jgi:hypothetical protein